MNSRDDQMERCSRLGSAYDPYPNDPFPPEPTPEPTAEEIAFQAELDAEAEAAQAALVGAETTEDIGEPIATDETLTTDGEPK